MNRNFHWAPGSPTQLTFGADDDESATSEVALADEANGRLIGRLRLRPLGCSSDDNQLLERVGARVERGVFTASHTNEPIATSLRQYMFSLELLHATTVTL